MSLSEEAQAEFARTNAPKRVLVNSVPKCGTTWLRTMLAALPGYEEYPRTKANGLKPEQLLDLEPGQVFHGHMTMNKKFREIVQDRDIATVYIYRDLRDAVVSDYFHKAKLNPNRAGGYVAENDKDMVLHADNLEEWCGPARRYADVKHWLNTPGIVTVTYEALKERPFEEMKRVLTELGFTVSDDVVTHTVEAGTFENMSGGRRPGEEDQSSGQRKGVIGDWRNHFTPDHIAAFKERYGDLLIEYGYETDKDW